MNEELKRFYKEKLDNCKAISLNKELKNIAIDFMEKTNEKKYTYNFCWMGRPIIAYPQDMIAMQELIWEVKPDLIIETGVAHGGSVVYYASLLELIGENGIVVGIDIDIRNHNRELIEQHPMGKRIKLIQGSSIEASTFRNVEALTNGRKKIMVCLDSNHSHEHVLKELELYAPLTSLNSYCVVFDTAIEDMPANYDFGNRPWGKGNNPKTAVLEFLKSNDQFEIDKLTDGKLLITVASDGYLKRLK